MRSFDPRSKSVTNVGIADTIFAGFYDNYNALIASETPGQNTGKIFKISNSQGTKWLYGSLGGTYYPSGDYIDNGISFVSDKLELARSMYELNKGIVIVDEISKIANKTLSSTIAYEAHVALDFGSDNIWIPDGGLTLIGKGVNVTKFTSIADNYTLFIKDPSATRAGALNFRDLTFSISGTNSKVFDLDNLEETNAENNNIDFINVNFINCTSCGVLKRYRQFFASPCSLIACGDGIELVGAWSGGFAMANSRLIQFSGTIFKAGSGLTFGGRFKSNAFVTVGGSAIVSNFSEANFINDADFQFSSGEFEGKTNFAGYFPNIEVGNRKVFFTDNQGFGIQNTRPGARWVNNGEVLTNLTLNTQTKLLGTKSFSGLQWFSVIGGNAVYTSDKPSAVNISGRIKVAGGSNDDLILTIKKWNNANSSFEIITQITERVVNVQGTRDLSIFIFDTYLNESTGGEIILNLGDYIDEDITNITDGTDVTKEDSSYLNTRKI